MTITKFWKVTEKARWLIEMEQISILMLECIIQNDII